MVINEKPGEREEVKRIMKNLRINTYNNYRKRHGLPMKRWKSLGMLEVVKGIKIKKER